MNRGTIHRARYRLAAVLLFCFALACSRASAQTTPTLAVDAAGNPHPINPDIYGSTPTSPKKSRFRIFGGAAMGPHGTTGKWTRATRVSTGILWAAMAKPRQLRAPQPI
jgi:hypothetical protein